MFQKSIALALSVALFVTSASAGVGSTSAAYRGGSIGLKEGSEKKFSLVGNGFTFGEKKNAYTIPYDRIQSIEYGQKSGRRIGAAVGWTIAIGPLGLLSLLSKKRKHMVSLVWTNDQGKNEGAVFEFGKDAIRSALTTLEAKSGKPVEYESDDAKANIGK